MLETMDQKIFFIINLSYFGDVLVTNALCQNIKKSYPDSKIVFVVNKPFYEAAKYQECVDDVLVLDKRGEHKGILGLIKFALNCPYRKKIFASFIIYGNERGIFLSWLLGAKKRISGYRFLSRPLITDVFEDKNCSFMQDINANYISVLTGKKPDIVPIKYLTNPDNDCMAQELLQKYRDKEIIALCTVGKHKENYMPVKTAAEIIHKLNSEGKTVFYLGTGEDCRKYADELREQGCVDFVDLTDKTTIYQLANIMQICKAVISIDTGTLHLAYATGIPTVGVFYRPQMVIKWAPRKKLYPFTAVINSEYTVENICSKLNELLEKTNKTPTHL